MREIKFRVWDGEKYNYESNVQENDHCYMISLTGEVYDCAYGRYEDGAIDLIIEQYTGLKDINGKEIYEGDILLEVQDEEYPLPENDLEKMVVEFVFGGFVASNERAHIELSNYGITDTQSADFYKVIGNIHQNHELLESVE